MESKTEVIDITLADEKTSIDAQVNLDKLSYLIDKYGKTYLSSLASLCVELPDCWEETAQLFKDVIDEFHTLQEHKRLRTLMTDSAVKPPVCDLPILSGRCNMLPGLRSKRADMAKELAYRFWNTIVYTDTVATANASKTLSVTALRYIDDLPSYIDKNSPPEQRKIAYVNYTKFKATLKRAHADQQASIALKKPANYGMCKLSKYHKARSSVNDYLESKELPLSEQITKPTPMEVSIADINELQAFFDRLAKNDPALPINTDEIGSYETFTRGAYYTDGRIDLCKQVVGPDHIEALCKSIRNNPNVKHFLLGNNIIGQTGAESISRLIADSNKACRISTWYLAGNCIEASGIKLIAESLAFNQDCKQLWLKRNPIGVEGAKYIANMLRTNKTIEVLDLDNTAIMDEGCVAIFEALKDNKTLRSIYLDANGLTSVSADAIADYFYHKKRIGVRGLELLSISINRLGSEGATTIVYSLAAYPLKSIALGSNRIESDGLKNILRWAGGAEHLRVLDIGYYKATADMGELPNSFGDEGARYIACFILLNTQVRYLNFHNTHIDDFSIIEAVMPFNTNLVSVTAEQGSASSKIIHQVTERNHNALYPGKSIKEIVRKMKHGEDVWVIDSIYRNKM